MIKDAPLLADSGEPGFGVYVHWPFCAAKCPYCDFNSHVRHVAVDQNAYVKAFLAEMTAMRAMQNNVEREFGQLGSRTFVINRFPNIMFGGREGFIKYLRRREITFSQAEKFRQKATLAESVGLNCTFRSAS